MLNFSSRSTSTINQISKVLNLRPSWGALGDWSQNLGTMSMLARGLYYVRVPTSNGLSATPWIVRGAYNSGTPMTYDHTVQLGYDTDGVAYIKGTDYDATQAAGGNATPIPPPTAGVVTSQSQIATLRVFQNPIQPSLKVMINGWKEVVAGVMYDYEGTPEFDLTSFVPGSGHCIVGIFMKDDYLTPIAYASTSIALNDPLTIADVNDVVTQAYTASHAYTPVWAFAVATGATQILDSDTFLDLRQFVKAGMS